MSIEYSLEIHYYQQYQAALAIQEDMKAKDNDLNKVILFNSYTLRQLHNLGNIGAAAARVLSLVKSSPEHYQYYLELIQSLSSVQELALHAPLLGALGVNLSYVVQFSIVPEIVMARASSGHEVTAIAREFWPDVVQIVDKRLSDGKHRFVCDLQIAPKKVFLNIDAKGFGLFGKNVNWYATTSIMVLYKYLIDTHEGNDIFKNTLAKSANLCGQAFLANKVKRASLLELPIAFALSAVS